MWAVGSHNVWKWNHFLVLEEISFAFRPFQLSKSPHKKNHTLAHSLHARRLCSSQAPPPPLLCFPTAAAFSPQRATFSSSLQLPPPPCPKLHQSPPPSLSDGLPSAAIVHRPSQWWIGRTALALGRQMLGLMRRRWRGSRWGGTEKLA